MWLGNGLVCGRLCVKKDICGPNDPLTHPQVNVSCDDWNNHSLSLLS